MCRRHVVALAAVLESAGSSGIEVKSTMVEVFVAAFVNGLVETFCIARCCASFCSIAFLMAVGLKSFAAAAPIRVSSGSTFGARKVTLAPVAAAECVEPAGIGCASST